MPRLPAALVIAMLVVTSVATITWYVRRSPGHARPVTAPANLRTFAVPDNRTPAPLRPSAPPPAPAPVLPPSVASAPALAPAPRPVPPPVPYVEVIAGPALDPAAFAAMPAGAADAPPRARRTLFLAANTAAWARVDVTTARPVRVQAGGQISLGRDQAGPDGMALSDVRGARIPASDLVLDSVPFLGLVGRVCSADECSPPFLVGSRALLCPSSLGVEGTLELWTNNRVREGTSTTRTNFSAALGGYHVYIDPAPATACGTRTAGGADLAEDAAALAAGRTLDRPEFVISSSQGAWKPFFLPLDRPLRIRADGEVRPGTNAPPTGPDGMRVPTAERWTYPGTHLVIDADHPLFEKTAPYQALIARTCNSETCGPVLVVGRERVVCAPAGFRDRVELWINHVIPPLSLLAQTTSLTMDTFDFQARSGEYRFTVSAAPAGACAG